MQDNDPKITGVTFVPTEDGYEQQPFQCDPPDVERTPIIPIKPPEPEHSVGDVVTLRSGGLRMTVEGHEPDGRVKLVWFEEGGGGFMLGGGHSRRRDSMPAACLRKVPA